MIYLCAYAAVYANLVLHWKIFHPVGLALFILWYQRNKPLSILRLTSIFFFQLLCLIFLFIYFWGLYITFIYRLYTFQILHDIILFRVWISISPNRVISIYLWNCYTRHISKENTVAIEQNKSSRIASTVFASTTAKRKNIFGILHSGYLHRGILLTAI